MHRAMVGKGSVFLALCAAVLGFRNDARAQSLTIPPPAVGQSYTLPPIGSSAPPALAVPAMPPATPLLADPAARTAKLEEQIRQLQLQNQQILNKFDVLSRQYEALRNSPPPFVPTASFITAQEAGGGQEGAAREKGGGDEYRSFR